MDTFALIAAERLRLADELALLSEDEWASDSLCEGWTAHTAAAHLTLPWEAGKVDLVLTLLKARGNLDRTIDRASRAVAARLTPAACVESLRAHAQDRTVPPTMPPEAPLTDVLVHGADILRPLGRAVAPDPEARERALGFLTSSAARRGFRSVSLEGLSFVATDTGWRWPEAGESGSGTRAVAGPSVALAGLLVGRRDHALDLEGDGVGVLLERLA
ncbi:maleylpyruvate isomerase family mycothiol-dependent enzyme [soil metagenome]